MDPALRARLSAGARERARDLDFDLHGERVLALYGQPDPAGVSAR
jgi:hypothetical protein